MLWVKHINKSGIIKAFTVSLLIIYILAVNQPVTSYSRVSSCLLMAN
jgi:hypothetical protein